VDPFSHLKNNPTNNSDCPKLNATRCAGSSDFNSIGILIYTLLSQPKLES